MAVCSIIFQPKVMVLFYSYFLSHLITLKYQIIPWDSFSWSINLNVHKFVEKREAVDQYQITGPSSCHLSTLSLPVRDTHLIQQNITLDPPPSPAHTGCCDAASEIRGFKRGEGWWWWWRGWWQVTCSESGLTWLVTISGSQHPTSPLPPPPHWKTKFQDRGPPAPGCITLKDISTGNKQQATDLAGWKCTNKLWRGNQPTTTSDTHQPPYYKITEQFTNTNNSPIAAVILNNLESHRASPTQLNK